MASLYLILALLATASEARFPSVSNTSPPQIIATPVYQAYAVDFSSALNAEASILFDFAQVSGVKAAVPIPSKIPPEYSAAAKLATGPLPPIQAGIGLPETHEMISNLVAQANATGSTHVGKRQSNLRVMVVDDSISHGQQGDYSWRYRIWQWFQSQGVAVTNVGPYTGTFRSTSSGPSDAKGGYYPGVDSGFLSNSAHFAYWGRTLAADVGLIADVLRNNPADLILLKLGFNDIGFFLSDYRGTLNSMQNFIKNARSVNPNIKFAIANVPQRTYILKRIVPCSDRSLTQFFEIGQDLVQNITNYNNMLPGYLQQWSTSQSPIQLVEYQQNYACGTTNCPAAYDGLLTHLQAILMPGENIRLPMLSQRPLLLALESAKTPLPVPSQGDSSLVRAISAPQNFKVFSSPQGVSATWDAVYGAYSYDVQVSINGGGGGFSGGTAGVNRFDSTWPIAGATYAVSVRASAGDQHGPYSGTQSAVAQPQLAPPPIDIVVSSTSDGFSVTWNPPTGPNTNNIVEYNVIYWDTEPSDCEFVTGAAFKSSPARVSGLRPGRNYLVAPLTWNAKGQGLPYIAHGVIPGAGTPSTPTNLQAYSNDGTSVHLTWQGPSSAAGYEVFVRNATGGQYMSLANQSAPCLDDFYLFPGTDTYQFAVASWNGNSQSPMGVGVITPKASSGAATQSCPPAPSWCPSFGAPYTGGYVGGCSGCGGDGCPSGGCAPRSGGGSGGSSAPSQSLSNPQKGLTGSTLALRGATYSDDLTANPTVPPTYPTNQPQQSTTVYCHSTSPAGLVYFDIASASSAVNSLCGAGRSLAPSATPILGVYGSHPAVTAALGWAPNQAGCQPEKGVDTSGSLGMSICKSIFGNIINACGTGLVYEGGGVVNSSQGCALFTIGAQIQLPK